MEDIDKKLLNEIQEGIKIDERPFNYIADKFNLTENEVIKRINILKKQGYIRRFGGVFSSKKLGYVSTLCAMSVPKDKIYKVAQTINKYDEVTHNYLREDKYNVWFTIIAPSKDKLNTIIETIKEDTGIHELINLPSNRDYKVKMVLDLEVNKDA
ncbi:Lrp/AsnC family transcriptional regulator [Clostridium rectalis]|uniref:siroheme decarboxylase subunit alpha n=1 Tax=Clostridium rectalis TaxID=2040295 RepID=UPI000F639F5A|nr:Lrp/AsnC family transcriptional regulator [Clostridium rectalis]